MIFGGLIAAALAFNLALSVVGNLTGWLILAAIILFCTLMEKV